MKSNVERFPGLVTLFRAAIIDQLKEQLKDGQKDKDGNLVYIPSTAALRSAAKLAMKEIVESHDCEPTEEQLADKAFEGPVSPMLAVNVWDAVMLSNESAFHQGLARDIEKKLVTGLVILKGAKAVAQGYVE